MFRGQKGITLVALVITIIVLLILAGVTIAALSGQNGILTNATKAKAEDEISNAKDQINLAANEGLQAYYSKTYANGTETVGANEKETVKQYIDAIIKGGKIGNATVSYSSSDSSYTVTSSDSSRVEKGTLGDKGGVTWSKEK